MNAIVLTAYDGKIIGPIAKGLGWIMNGIYNALLFISNDHIDNIALCIVLLTILIYACLLPLTIKQQKFSKLNQMMQPEIKAIQEKYKNKKDQASMAAMNAETQDVYAKYGVSPMGSCIQLVIQMPILFALYRVFYNAPAYMSTVKGYFSSVVDSIYNTDGFADTLTTIKGNYSSLKAVTTNFDADSASSVKNYIVDLLYKLPKDGWKELSATFTDSSSSIDALASHVNKMNNLFGLNISETPWYIIKSNWSASTFGWVILALMIPVLAYVTQFLNVKLAPTANNNDPNDQMARQMKTMNLFMPLISFFMCFSVPVGLGFYWIVGAVIRSIQQVVINHHIKNLDLDKVIEKNAEKAKKKREKRGIYENQIREAAALRTKNIQSKANTTSVDIEVELEKANAAKANAKPGSLASKANLVKEFNEKNSSK